MKPLTQSVSRRTTIASLGALALIACGGPDSAARASAAAERSAPQSAAEDTACRCRIVLHKVVSLGDNDDAVVLRPGTVLSRDAAGRYLASVTDAQSSIGVFAANGNPLASFGRRGSGPGELERIRYAQAMQGDSVLVMDQRNLTLFAPSGSPERWGALPNGVAAFRFAVLKSGHVVVNNYFPTHPSMILLDRTFAAVREFGSTTPADSRNDSDAIQYHVVGLDSGRFVAVRQNYRYGIEVWDTTGTLVRQFDRVPAWYRPWTESDKRAHNHRTHAFPVITGVYADGAQLWIAARVPDPTWKDPDAPLRAAERGRESASKPVPVDEYDRRYDTIIEVLDVATGRVLVSQRFDAFIARFTDGGLLYDIQEAPSLLLRADVWRPEIVQQP